MNTHALGSSATRSTDRIGAALHDTEPSKFNSGVGSIRITLTDDVVDLFTDVRHRLSTVVELFPSFHLAPSPVQLRRCHRLSLPSAIGRVQ